MLSSVSSPGDGEPESDAGAPRARREHARLLSENRDLSTQLSVLRDQFQRALAFSEELERARAQQAAAAGEAARLRAERDDLERRLRCALQPGAAPRDGGEELSALGGALARERAEGERARLRCAELEGEAGALCRAAARCFGAAVDSPQALLERGAPAGGPGAEARSRALRLRLRRRRAEAAESRAARRAAQAELDACRRHAAARGAQLAGQIQDSEGRRRAQAEQIAQLAREKEALLLELDEKAARVRIAALHADQRQAGECERLARQLAEAAERLKACLAAGKALAQKAEKAKAKAQVLKKENQELESEIRAVQKERNDLRFEAERLANAGGETARRVRELETLLERAREAQARQAKEIDGLTDTVGRLESAGKQQARNAEDIRTEKDFLTKQAQREERTKREIEERLDALQSQVMEKDKAIHELQTQLREALRPQEIEKMLPLSCWTSHELPGELQDAVKDIARNPSFPVTSKVQVAFDHIAKWFKVRYERLELDFTKARELYVDLKGKMDSLIASLKKIMPDIRINFDLLLSDEMTRAVFTDAIIALKTSVTESITARKQLESQMSNLCASLNVTTIDEISQAIQEINQTIDAFRRKAKQKGSKRAQVRLAVQEAEKKVKDAERHVARLEQEIGILRDEASNLHIALDRKSAEATELEAQLTNKINEYDSIKNEYAALNEASVRLRRKKQRLEKQLRDVQVLIDDLENRQKERVRTMKEKAQAQYRQLTEITQQQITALQSTVRELSDKAVKYEATNTELEARNQELALQIQKLESKATTIQNESERDRKGWESQSNARLMMAETEYKSKLEEVQTTALAARNQLIDAIVRNFERLVDGMKITDSNVEAALQVIRRKIDALNARELHMRSLLGLNVSQSIEDALIRLRPSRRRSSRR
jgi:chromosome segregation ATPase